MHRLTTMTATAAALFAALFTASPPEDDDGWRRQGNYNSQYTCQAAGAAGALFGQWEDWMCDDDDVLWVRD